MGAYINRRLIQSVFVLLGLSLIIFFVTRQIGDAARLMLPIDAPESQYLAMRRQMGLDEPLHMQLVNYFWGLLRGDFGISHWQNIPAMDLVLARFPATAYLALATIVFSLAIAIPVGTFAAMHPGSWIDRIASVLAIFGLSVPTFWLALVLISVFALQLGWFRTSGYGGGEYLVLPVLALSAASIGRLVQVVRSSMLDVLTAQYLTTARSKGLREYTVIARHGLRNALLPILTISGDEIIGLLNGSVAIELIFGWPGIGRLILEAIERRDFAVIQASVFFVAVIVVLVNLLIDLLYAKADPRISYR